MLLLNKVSSRSSSCICQFLHFIFFWKKRFFQLCPKAIKFDPKCTRNIRDLDKYFLLYIIPSIKWISYCCVSCIWNWFFNFQMKFITTSLYILNPSKAGQQTMLYSRNNISDSWPHWFLVHFKLKFCWKKFFAIVVTSMSIV
jgi:hypothetical protein